MTGILWVFRCVCLLFLVCDCCACCACCACVPSDMNVIGEVVLSESERTKLEERLSEEEME